VIPGVDAGGAVIALVFFVVARRGETNFFVVSMHFSFRIFGLGIEDCGDCMRILKVPAILLP